MIALRWHLIGGSALAVMALSQAAYAETNCYQDCKMIILDVGFYATLNTASLFVIGNTVIAKKIVKHPSALQSQAL